MTEFAVLEKLCTGIIHYAYEATNISCYSGAMICYSEAMFCYSEAMICYNGAMFCNNGINVLLVIVRP